MDLNELRGRIDSIDEQIIRLYEERMDVCRQVAEYKIENGKKVYDRVREEEKLAKARTMAHSDFTAQGISELFEQIMSMSRKLQYQLLIEKGQTGRLPFFAVDRLDTRKARVVFQGAEGAYSQAAMVSYFGEQIDSAKNVHQIFVLFNPPYYLTFIKFAASALSEKDLGQLLSTAWTQEECPNQDCNVSKRELVALFRSVPPESLMDEEERAAHQAMEDTVTVYRGVTPYNAKNIRALSWTLDRKTADWFAHRFGEEGTVYEAQIRKEHILALFTGRNESEVIVDPRHLEQIMESPEPGFDMQMT